MTLSTTLFIERGFLTIVGGFFGLGYPIRDMQARMRFSLSNKINVQHNDAENGRTSPRSSRVEQEDNVSGIRDHLARWTRG
jgi:hypothetical protein